MSQVLMQVGGDLGEGLLHCATRQQATGLKVSSAETWPCQPVLRTQKSKSELSARRTQVWATNLQHTLGSQTNRQDLCRSHGIDGPSRLSAMTCAATSWICTSNHMKSTMFGATVVVAHGGMLSLTTFACMFLFFEFAFNWFSQVAKLDCLCCKIGNANECCMSWSGLLQEGYRVRLHLLPTLSKNFLRLACHKCYFWRVRAVFTRAGALWCQSEDEKRMDWTWL